VEPFRLDPRYLPFGYFGVAYCLTTPLVLTVMALHHPHVNELAMRLSALLGLIFATISMPSPL